MSLPVKRTLEDLRYEADWFHPEDDIQAGILLNAQRTVQAFRTQIAENTKWSDLAANQLIGLAEKNILIARERDGAEQKYKAVLKGIDDITRERDNARAALEECQKLNATLREDLVKVNERRTLIKESWDALFDRKEQLIKQLTAMTVERDRALGIMDRAIHLLDECKAPSKGHDGDCSANTECDGRCSNQAAWIADYIELIQQATEAK
tara:strand:+ start:1963 stop:2589 length:627 start_codon:yes stop_codon:yes gene_type:complete